MSRDCRAIPERLPGPGVQPRTRVAWVGRLIPRRSLLRSRRSEPPVGQRGKCGLAACPDPYRSRAARTTRIVQVLVRDANGAQGGAGVRHRKAAESPLLVSVREARRSGPRAYGIV